MSDIPLQLWRWVRGEIPHDEFGYWLYDNADSIKSALPKDNAAKLIGLDFWPAPVTGSDAERMQARLARELPRRCACPLMLDRQRLPLGFEFLPERFQEVFKELAERTPWLTLSRCRRCGQNWYVACDTVDDDWYFQRLDVAAAERALASKQWPDTFDGWVNVWPEGTQLGPQTIQKKQFDGGRLITDFFGGLSTG
jgi:hypothetical protein